MASMGLKYLAVAEVATEPAAAVPTYKAGLVLGKMVSANLSITNSEGEIHADDMLAEYVSEFASADFTAEVDNITLANQAMVYGATFEGDEFRASNNDVAPYIGLGGYQVLMVGGARKYRAWFFAKGRASIPDWDAATKGSSISFGTQPIKVKIMPPTFGAWYYLKEFDTEAGAKAYIDTKLGVRAWHEMSVQVQGAGKNEGATPAGATFVAAGEDFVLTLTGTPTAIYDNGAEVTASISGGKYTVEGAAEDHAIAVIF